MHEQLPVLRDAINQLEQTNQPLANELSGLVEELSAQLEKKQLDAIQATEEKIHDFLTIHEKEVTIGDRKQELDTLKTTISSPSASQPVSQPTSRWSRLRGADKDEATGSTTSASHPPAAEPEEQTSRRERWGKTGATRVAGISALLVTLHRWKNKSTQNTTPDEQPQNPSVISVPPETPSPHTPEQQSEGFPSQAEYKNLLPEQKRLVCMRYLVEKLNYSPAISAGIVGNIQKESSFKSDALGDGGSSYGLCQRHDAPDNPKNRRRTDLKNYSAQYGNGQPAYLIQLAFIGYELAGKEHAARDKLQTATTPQQAAELFCTEYERPDPKSAHLELRKQYATQAFTQYQGPIVA